ncbi:MAG: hypothetical protein UV61_C0005G0020 [Candidatus Gottesmanbacteria bacterium GW2011_GWB1_43_11]|uniref:Uncharacterized protein n=1 Tax=Candidatus Gottesmanbacteria bacterium GW2011_GWB1_43_11 TaxID=1618446 RepID=A0A0G1CN75_9BACT|nr:MAG: hypothetical protein UV04_C0010G0020 [Candidatus Gottesmanbacteria bacterium GW2011_GWA2_42_16]KKS55911.1 MAG: hypothetical protein UV17_C0005G0020 [Candidatus Gottesmanbacteria bacterium GW2011_GWA1_42_26]KKS86999.1 MAG: hypothetical protein UV61_C0005G0020 [Candidatus Gottesmanbacteria bacterium GW2011_GWB1_43_11]OGG07809.1 MAG: hypothetical protein A2699_04550 [Candidatus Gottesmanbacteria bacterium RIFCSPHIGHO2_01_FULL_43_15]OGG28129.1 MAG: hypothetical protein A3A59_00685 [Candidat
MKLRDKIMYLWLMLSGIAVVFGGDSSRGIFNILLGVVANIVLWYLIFQLVFWIYDKTKQIRNK